MNQIPLSKTVLTQEEMNAVIEVLKSGWLTHGEWNERFEESFAKYVGVKHAISMNSCTSALQLALQTNGIRGEVLVPSFTFSASVNAILLAGATPIFVDVDYHSRNIDPEIVEESITEETEALMIVHFGGQMCNMDRIMSIVKKHRLLLVEDCAETLGGTYKGKQAGSYGIGCFSFFPTKNITTGEGGMLVTNDDELARRVRALIGHGMLNTTKDREAHLKPWYRSSSFPGYNLRMTNFQAALGYHQLQRLDEMNNSRRKLALVYNKKLEEISSVRPPMENIFSKHVYQMYTITVDGDKRNDLVRYLRSEGIGVSVHFDPPVHLQEYYNGKKTFRRLRVDSTEKLCGDILTLPLYPEMVPQDIGRVTESVLEFFNRNV